MMAKRYTAGRSRPPVTAAHPTRGGMDPAAPPMTMFWGGGALQPTGIDQGIEQGRRQGEQGRQEIDPGEKKPESDDVEADPEGQGVEGSDTPAGNGAKPGAGHAFVDVPVQIVVDGIGAAGGQGAAEADQPHQHG